MKRQHLLWLLIGAYALLAFGLGVSRLTNRPAGDQLPIVGLVASIILYLATSLGIAWLLHLAITRRAPAVAIAKRRTMKLTHLKRKQKGFVCNQRLFQQQHQEQQQLAALRNQALNRYHLAYQRANKQA